MQDLRKIKKHKRLASFLRRIQGLLGQKAIQIVDYWDSDLCAIGLRKKQKLLYIGTYPYISNTKRLYDYELELIEDDASNSSITLEEGRAVKEPMLIRVIERL